MDRLVPKRCQNNAPLRGGRTNIVFGEADPPTGREQDAENRRPKTSHSFPAGR
jgi:hypothetical protein